MAGRLARATQQLDQAKSARDPWKQHQAAARVRRFGDLLEQWKQPVDPSPRQVEVEILRIGELAIVAMPGEPFAEVGAAVKKASPFAYTMFCGYSDGVGGDYMPIASEYTFGGYEVERTPYGSGPRGKSSTARSDCLIGCGELVRRWLGPVCWVGEMSPRMATRQAKSLRHVAAGQDFRRAVRFKLSP